MRKGPGILTGFIFLLLFACSENVRTDGGKNSSPKIFTSGFAERRIKPNLAAIYFSVLTRSPQAEKARHDNADKVNAIVEKLRDLKISENQLETLDYRVQEMTSYHEGASRVDGYEVISQMKLSTSNTALVGKAIDQVIPLGANKIDRIEFDVAEREEIYRELLEQATTMARDKAARMADAASLGKITVVEVHEEPTDGGGPQPMQARFAMAGAASATPISGSALLRAQVSLTAQTKN